MDNRHRISESPRIHVSPPAPQAQPLDGSAQFHSRFGRGPMRPPPNHLASLPPHPHSPAFGRLGRPHPAAPEACRSRHRSAIPTITGRSSGPLLPMPRCSARPCNLCRAHPAGSTITPHTVELPAPLSPPHTRISSPHTHSAALSRLGQPHSRHAAPATTTATTPLSPPSPAAP